MVLILHKYPKHLSPMASMLLSLFSLLSFSAIYAVTAQTQVSNISLGSSLSTNTTPNYWSSPSRLFAFGFYPISNGFKVGIWIMGASKNTVVWTARRDDPPISSGTVILSENGTLLLRSNRSNVSVPFLDASQPASYASMQDNGNFILYNGRSRVIWESFKFPTDTIVAEQRLPMQTTLFSHASDANHSIGRFRIVMHSDGNLVSYPTGTTNTSVDAYWHSDTWWGGSNVSLNLNDDGRLYLVNTTGLNIKNLTESRSGRFVYRATMDTDGVFRLYSHRIQSNGSISDASTVWETISLGDRCQIKGLCGFNSFCTMLNLVPTCSCPPGFNHVEPSQSFLGCNLTVEEDCGGASNMTFEIDALTELSWLDNPYGLSWMTDAEGCKKNCLNDCNCSVALFANGRCAKQKLPLRYGNTNHSTTTFIKVKGIGTLEKNPTLYKTQIKLSNGILIVGIILISCSVVVFTVSGCLIYKRCTWVQRPIVDNSISLAFIEDMNLRSFTYDELVRVTNDFEEELGRGSFGKVYKGALSNGVQVAVKKIERLAEDGEKEFEAEMKTVGKTHHRNLVRLMGFCNEGSNRILVYEYMSNGSLADFLFKAKTGPDWNERVRIAVDVAKGIQYLHEECETQIIHCDIKPQNILIDEYWTPKISDFGLAKLLMPDQTKTYTGLRGTRGYVAPEWHKSSPITTKVDVYSYGIVLLEIACCRRHLELNVPENEIILLDWVCNCFEHGELERLIDDKEVEKTELERVISVGLWCTQEQPASRPTMKKVILMLEGMVITPTPPTASIS